MTERVFLGFVADDGKFKLDFPAQFRAYAGRKEFRGEEVEIEFRKRRTKRSDRQNRALWAALTPWAHELGYEPTELKNELMALLWGYEEAASPLTGELRIIPNKSRSSRLSTREMSELMEFAAVKAAETGYVMELPDEFKARKQAARAAKKASRAA